MSTKISVLATLLLCLIANISTIYAQPTPPSGKKWVKIDAMSDEFNGNSLNNAKWAKTIRNGKVDLLLGLNNLPYLSAMEILK